MIEATALTRVFGSVQAVGGLTFSVAPGEIVGLLGPNGAGKTTTLRMLAALLAPTSGSARIAGFDSSRQPLDVRRRLGFVSGTAALLPRLTPRELLFYMGRLHSIPEATLAPQVEAAIERFEVEPFAELRCGALSTGQRQRVLLARASLHDPPALILDEPSSGLDVLGAQAVAAFVRAAAEQGKAVLLSTHDMAEAEYLCQRVLIVGGGRLIAEGTPEKLAAASGKKKLAEVFLHYLGSESA